MPLHYWPVITFCMLTLILLSLEHVKQMQSGCFILKDKRRHLSTSVQQSSQKLVPFSLASKCGMIYIKFLNACTVAYFCRLVKNKISPGADVLAIKWHMKGDVTHHASRTSFLFHILYYGWFLHEAAALWNQWYWYMPWLEPCIYTSLSCVL